ncbi:MAG: MOSC domain-containing protein [Acidimicrobiales bacterium]
MIVTELRRFPIKSMLGEVLAHVAVGPTGLVGDRAHALVDQETGKVVSAKDPRRWGELLAHRASYIDNPGAGRPILIETDGGGQLRSDAEAIDERLSEAVGRPVRLARVPLPGDSYDDVWPDVEGIAPAAFLDATEIGRTETGERISGLPVGMLAPGTYQDVSPVTVLTTASIRAAAALHPDGDWDPRRFRANVLIDLDDDGFVENTWVGANLVIGDVALNIMAPTPRCVMTTLAQEDLPRDRAVLRTVAAHNRAEVADMGAFACLGAYASVVDVGELAVGDRVILQR